MLSETEKARMLKAEMLNFGSGPSAYAFDYEAAGVNGMNLAMTPSAFGMETALLNEYAQYFPKDCPAVFVICPFSFGENESNKNPLRFAKYYGVLSRQAIKSLPSPLPRWDAKAAETVNPDFPLFPYGVDLHRDEVPSDEVMDARVEAMCQCWKRELQLKDFFDVSQAEAHRKSFARERKAMLETLDTAVSIGLRPFLLLPPLHSKLRKLISKEFFDEFVMRQIDGVDVPVLDYTSNQMIEDRMFLGPVFLNKAGAECFTKSVWSIVTSPMYNKR